MPGLQDRGRIRELPEVVRNQIAAGEVVERPASVVKELVENALDAGAGAIRVDLEEGGAKLVRVVDDGGGMGAEDLELVFRPHATSKLRELGDLDHVASLGFRGEALASIGAVARCRILSRAADETVGAEVRDDGGAIGRVAEAGAPLGTTVEVRDLFHNTPARRRFLKRTQTELARCLDVLQRLALAHEGVAFVVTHDGRRALDVEAGLDLRGRVRRLFGAELADALVPVAHDDGHLRLAGLIAPPRFARRDASRQMWFLNGRPLRDRVLTRVLKEGYRGYLVEGRQPAAFLSLSLDPAQVDVNVHPTKTEVRFREERRLFGVLVNVLREAVARTDVATPGERLLERVERRGEWRARVDAPGQSWLPDPGTAPGSTPTAREPLPTYDVPRGASDAGEAPPPVPAAGPNDAWRPQDQLRGPFLQVADTYLVRALPDGFEIVDQHALHERLTYEELRAELREGRVESQRLLVPEVVEVSREEGELLEPCTDALAQFGIELSRLGEREVAVHGLPARLRQPDAAGVVRDVLALLRQHGRVPEAEEVLEEFLHRTACRSSVMAGDPLTQDQIHALLQRAREAGNDQTCPHARPTRVRFTLADLEKAFHRR